MLRTTRISLIFLVAAAAVGIAACSGDNESPTTGGSSGSASTPTAGTASTAIAGTASTPTAGTTSTPTAGTGSSTAGTSTGAGTGGMASAGTGPIATAGSAGTASGVAFTPLCAGLTTAAGMAPTKAGACTADDPQTCYKTCGPASSGFKSEMCSAGAYAEQSGCTFPDTLDATCYKLPAAQDATCPATAPMASAECSVAPCTLCNLGGGPTGTYLDSKGASKVGYCVCPAPGASGTSKWSCASTDAWPCPGAKGC
jgi:hypothetical protein